MNEEIDAHVYTHVLTVRTYTNGKKMHMLTQRIKHTHIHMNTHTHTHTRDYTFLKNLVFDKFP